MTIKGKLGSTTKKVSQKFVIVNANGNKLTISGAKSKAVAKKSALAAKAINTELSDAIYGVENGIEKKMKVLFAHFPTSLEVKGKKLGGRNIALIHAY